MRRRAEAVDCGDVIWIFLTRGKVAIVDAEDSALAAFLWYAEQRGGLWYARRDVQTGGARKRIYLHAAVAERAGFPASDTVDHRDGDGLNDSRSNLRPATFLENARNTKKRSNNTSGHKGVSWHRQCSRWTARIKVDGVYRSLGVFVTKEEAAEAYRAAASRAFADFARP